jgi:hypothetical protein
MKRTFQRVTALALFILALGAGLAHSSGTAHADWGDEDRLLPLTTTLSNLVSNPFVASIERRHCKPEAVATWGKTQVSFRIVNDGVSSTFVNSVRAGMLSWNSTGSPYKFVETKSSNADIKVTVSSRLLPRNTLGYADVRCSADASRIQSASITVNVAGLTANGVRTVAAHEAGHALGLGHADKQGDLMNARFDVLLSALTPVCPSNLDRGALTSKKDPFKMAVSQVHAPKAC